MLSVWRYKMKREIFKTGDIVLYVANNIVEIGKLGANYNKNNWIVIPLTPFKRNVIRKECFLRKAEDVKKFLTNTK